SEMQIEKEESLEEGEIRPPNEESLKEGIIRISKEEILEEEENKDLKEEENKDLNEIKKKEELIENNVENEIKMKEEVEEPITKKAEEDKKEFEENKSPLEAQNESSPIEIQISKSFLIFNSESDTRYKINLFPDLKKINLDSKEFGFLADENLQKLESPIEEIMDKVKLEVYTVNERRIQNLAIKLDKIKHYLKLIGLDKSSKPPLKILSSKETYEYFFDYIFSTLLMKFNKLLEDKILCKEGEENINTIIQKIKGLKENYEGKVEENEENYDIAVNHGRMVLLEISPLLRETKKSEDNRQQSSTNEQIEEIKKEPNENNSSPPIPNFEVMADILTLYAKTKIHFKLSEELKEVDSDTIIEIKKRDIDSASFADKFANASLDSVIAEDHKRYGVNYIWGELTEWFKQDPVTIDSPFPNEKPDGILCYPEIERLFEYYGPDHPFGEKDIFYKKLIYNYSEPWDIKENKTKSPSKKEEKIKHEKYDYRNKIYGTVQLDGVLFGLENTNQVKIYIENQLNSLIYNEGKINNLV
ncbi:MAG: hypothetical protein MJ252_29020, partial [archaeon]|nr:hypothetical protein [archaeon]